MEINFWKDKDKKIINTELFSKDAEAFAKEIYEEGGGRNKPTQIRKFYDEVLRFESMLKGMTQEKQKDEFNNILPYLKMLNAKAAYSMGRDLVSQEFKDFISTSLNQIKDKDDFEVFRGLFESFIGFYKFEEENGKKTQQGGRR